MTNINATNLRKNLFEYLNQAVIFNDIINVNTKNGNAVIMSEEDYGSLMETLYLMSAKQTYNELLEAKSALDDEFVNEKDVEW